VSAVHPCVVIPIHEHGRTIGAVVEGLAPLRLPCLIVDDGSGPATREALERAAKEHPFVEVLRLARNRGKGRALEHGYRAAWARGHTHVVQLDADGQHDPRDTARFVETFRAHPEALVIGVPVFDASVPRARLYARQLSRGLVWLACLSRAVPDPLCGYRGLPLAPTVALLDRVATGSRMDFDPELAVRLVWEGLPVACVRTPVVYHPGGLSHFSLRRDYPRLAWLYVRLTAGMLPRAPWLLRTRETRRVR